MTSIDAGVEVIASIADDADFLPDLQKSDIKVALHRHGNWSVASQCGIDASSNSNVVIMDGADSTFNRGALEIISKALNSGHLIVQPRIEFKTDSSLRSRLLANVRMHENRFEAKSYSPGLGLNSHELVKIIGLDGEIYDRNVTFGDDGALNQRRKEAGVDVFVASDAIIFHDALTYEHELNNAFQFGIGERQYQQSTANPKTPSEFIWGELFSDKARDYYKSALAQYGVLTVLQMLRLQVEYFRGYCHED